MGNPYIGISWVYKPPLLGPWVYPLPLGNNGCLDPSKWIGMPTKSDICWIFENNIMALLKWLQNRNEPLKKQLGMCCQVVVQSFKKLTCSRCCTCTTLHIWVPAAKIPKIPNLTTTLGIQFICFGFSDTDSSFQKTLVLIGFFPVGICQTDRSLTSWYQGDFWESSPFFGEEGRLNCQEDDLKISQFNFHFGLQFWSSSCFGIIFFESEASRRKAFWIGVFNPPRSNISTYQIIAMTFATFRSYQTLTVPEVGRWIYAKERLGWKLFHAAASNLVCEKDFDNFEVVLGVFCCQYL